MVVMDMWYNEEEELDEWAEEFGDPRYQEGDTYYREFDDSEGEEGEEEERDSDEYFR
jgi:hypothetical protein